VRRCLQGDSIAPRELVMRFESEVFGLCVRLLRNRHDAEDIAQDVFLRVFRSLGKWDQTRALRPWILTITVNRCRTALTKRTRRHELTEFIGEIPDSAPPPADRELTEAIAACVAELRDEYREVFILFHETGRNYEEIAEIIGRPVGTIKTWLHRARKMVLEGLRERNLMLDEPEPEAAPNQK
jgi:RNA polymerase sigma factor (sigma-70 family)